MFQVHPLIALLPVGLFLGAGVVAVLGLFFNREMFKEVLLWMIVIGLLATIPNIYTGLKDADNVFPDQRMIELLLLHERNAYILLTFFAFLFFWLFIRRDKMVFSEYMLLTLILLFGCSSVIYEVVTGYELVYHHGANVTKSCPPSEIENVSLSK